MAPTDQLAPDAAKAEKRKNRNALQSQSVRKASCGSATTADGLTGRLSMTHATALEDRRNLSSEIAAKYGVFSEGKALAFTYTTVSGKVHNVKLRLQNKDHRFQIVGKPLELWNAKCLGHDNLEDAPLVITEGEFDALACLQVGYEFVVSVPNGAPRNAGTGNIDPSDDGRFKFLWNNGELRPEIDRFKRIILATDGDEPGNALREELAVRLGEYRCDFVVWPEGCKDANDVLMHHSEAILFDCLLNAKPYLVDEVCEFDDIPDPGPITTYSSGYGILDNNLQFIRPELVIISGKPGSGKSQFAKSITANLARNHGWKWLVFAGEERAKPRLIRDYRTYFLEKPAHEAYSDELRDADAWANHHFKILQRRAFEKNNLDWLLARIEYAVKRYEIQGVYLDPWNEIEHQRQGGQSQTEYINDALIELKRIADRFSLLMMIVAHPRKMDSDTAPSLYDIDGSAAWYNKADHGIIVDWHGVASEPAKINILKSKDHEVMGRPGEVEMHYNQQLARYQ